MILTYGIVHVVSFLRFSNGSWTDLVFFCPLVIVLVVLFQHHQDHPRSSSTFDPPFDIAPFVIGVKGLGFPEE